MYGLQHYRTILPRKRHIFTLYNTGMDGLLPVNKPIGMSSTDVIRAFKRSTQFKGKIGHAGTLDVFAQGLVILMLGKATKKFDELQTQDKVYQAGVRLGCSSDTRDVEGKFSLQVDDKRPSLAEVVNASQKYIGEYEQTVPLYSAAKQDGQPLYKLARQNKKIKPKSKPVTIHSVDVVSYMYPLATMDVSCSSGTYVRQLTHDIFSELGLESFLFFLRRTRIGYISLDQACEIADFATDSWQKSVLEIE